MRPLTETCPKPLLKVGNIALIDRLREQLTACGVIDFTINAHYLAEQIVSHFSDFSDCHVIVEGSRLETGGAVVHALADVRIAKRLGDEFWIANSDSLWSYNNENSLVAMAEMWHKMKIRDFGAMDILLMLCPVERAHGYNGRGDFVMDSERRLRRIEPTDRQEKFVFCGVQIVRASIFKDFAVEYFSLNALYDAAIAHNRLYGYVHRGDWWHVGTPSDLLDAEKYLAKRQ